MKVLAALLLQHVAPRGQCILDTQGKDQGVFFSKLMKMNFWFRFRESVILPSPRGLEIAVDYAAKA